MSRFFSETNKSYREKAMNLFAGGLSPDAEKKLETILTYTVSRIENAVITDVEGNQIIDFSSGWASNNVGNIHPEVLDAAITALKRFGFCYNHPIAFQLAEKLIENTPTNLKRVKLEVSGTEAVEAAVSQAITTKERPLIISFTGQYHGDSIGGRNLGALEGERKRYFEAMHGGVIFAPYPKSFKIPMGMTLEEYGKFCIWYIDDLVLEHITTPDRIAGVLFEPMLAEGGNFIPPRNFIEGLRKLADKYGWFLLCDEVLTGIGRTGKMWGIEHYGVDVDAIITAKGLTGGLIPIGAVVGSEEYMGEKSAYSGSTFAGSPAGCAAAIKTFDIIIRDGLLERAAKLGEEALKILKEWADRYELVADARGVGLLLGITIVRDPDKLVEDPELARRIFVEATKNGVRAIWDDEPHIRIYPPLTIEEDLLWLGLDRLEETIRRFNQELFGH